MRLGNRPKEVDLNATGLVYCLILYSFSKFQFQITYTFNNNLKETYTFKERNMFCLMFTNASGNLFFSFMKINHQLIREVEAKIRGNHAQVAQTAHSTFDQVLVFKLTQLGDWAPLLSLHELHQANEAKGRRKRRNIISQRPSLHSSLGEKKQKEVILNGCSSLGKLATTFSLVFKQLLGRDHNVFFFPPACSDHLNHGSKLQSPL